MFHKKIYSKYELLLCIISVFVDLTTAFDDQIETCQSNMFSNNDREHSSNNAVFDDSNASIYNSHGAIKEEIPLFDWEELLSDIKPIIRDCYREKILPFCGGR